MKEKKAQFSSSKMAASRAKHPRTITEEEVYDMSNQCFCLQALPCFGRRSSNDHARLLQGEHNDKGTGYLQERLKEAKEWTEAMAGPKWKNFLRKLGTYFNENGRRRYRASPYDSFNYALNFDDGLMDQEDEVNDRMVRGFSARYAGSFYQAQEDNKQSIRPVG